MGRGGLNYDVGVGECSCRSAVFLWFSSAGPLAWSIGGGAWACACARPSCGPGPGLGVCAVGATVQLSLVGGGQSESCSCFAQGWRPFASRSASISQQTLC